MLLLSEQFHEQLSQVEQQFRDWSTFEQLYATVELTRQFKSPYRYFLSQIFQTHAPSENAALVNHNIDEANTPSTRPTELSKSAIVFLLCLGMVACRQSASLEKILTTLQLYLPSISMQKIDGALLDAYRELLVHLDSKLIHPKNLSSFDSPVVNALEQILFFIQANPNLQHLSSQLPHLVQITKQHTHPKPLQPFASVRFEQPVSTAIPFASYASEGASSVLSNTDLTCLKSNDSGLDLSETDMIHPMHRFLASQKRHTSLARSHSANTPSVGIVLSSPAREPSANKLPAPAHAPLTAVCSAPMPSMSSEYRQTRGTLAKSDEEEPESDEPAMNASGRSLYQSKDEFSSDENNSAQHPLRLGQYYSLRQRPNKATPTSNDVSQYLGVDRPCASMRNTFFQPNSGMTGESDDRHVRRIIAPSSF